ncbi:hypothetical protein Hanom_Chr02g00160931 [Helianthus anomalus]
MSKQLKFHKILNKFRPNLGLKQAIKSHTSTISTFPEVSNNPARAALSTLKGKLPTKILRSGEKLCSC